MGLRGFHFKVLDFICIDNFGRHNQNNNANIVLWRVYKKKTLTQKMWRVIRLRFIDRENPDIHVLTFISGAFENVLSNTVLIED